MKRVIRPYFVYSLGYPHAYQRIRSRIEIMVEDFPEWDIQVLSSTTARLVHTACRHLGVRQATYGPRRMRERATNLIAFWDFRDSGVAATIRSYLDRMFVEVYDDQFEGAGGRARTAVRGGDYE